MADSKLSRPEIIGWSNLVDWFGAEPSFHDAEIKSLCLNKSGDSQIVVSTWNTSKFQDSEGFLIREKEINVRFIIRFIHDLCLEGFSHQNVIFSASIDIIMHKGGKLMKLNLDPSYGIGGWVKAEQISVELCN